MEDVAGRLDRRSREGVAGQARTLWGTVRFRYRLAASLTGYAVMGFVAWYALVNLPGWASFDSSTGQLAGTPTSSSIGTYANIEISVSDGQATAT